MFGASIDLTPPAESYPTRLLNFYTHNMVRLDEEEVKKESKVPTIQK
jgi:hypothetical protein